MACKVGEINNCITAYLCPVRRPILIIGNPRDVRVGCGGFVALHSLGADFAVRLQWVRVRARQGGIGGRKQHRIKNHHRNPAACVQLSSIKRNE